MGKVLKIWKFPSTKSISAPLAAASKRAETRSSNWGDQMDSDDEFFGDDLADIEHDRAEGGGDGGKDGDGGDGGKDGGDGSEASCCSHLAARRSREPPRALSADGGERSDSPGPDAAAPACACGSARGPWKNPPSSVLLDEARATWLG